MREITFESLVEQLEGLGKQIAALRAERDELKQALAALLNAASGSHVKNTEQFANARALFNKHQGNQQ